MCTPSGSERRICCDAGISRIIMNGPSQLIDVGREQRLFRCGIRKALMIREQGCRTTSCNAPPSQCDGHHIVHWDDGGPTTTANGALLCPGDTNAMLTFSSPTEPVLTSWPRSLA